MKLKIGPVKWSASVLVLVLIGLGLFFLLPSSDNLRNERHLTIGVPALPSSALIILADQQKLFEKHGVNVKIEFVNMGKDALQNLIEGNYDLAVAYETPIAKLIIQGSQLRILTKLHSSSQNTSILYHQDRFNEQNIDLEGHSIGIIPGSNAEFLLSLYVMANMADTSKIEVIQEDWESLKTNFVEGNTDAAIFWEPTISKLLKTHPGKFGVVNFPFYTEVSMLVTTPFKLKTFSHRIYSLLRALVEAEQTFNKDPEFARVQVSNVLEQENERQEIDKAMWNKVEPRLGLSTLLTTLLEIQGRWILKNKNRNVPQFSQYYAPEYLSSVAPDKVTYK